MDKKHLFTAIAVTCFLTACGKKENEMEEVADPVGPMSEPIAATPPPVIKVPERMESQTSINNKSAEAQLHGREKVVIGVKLCDDFLDRYRACYMDMPANMQDNVKSGLESAEKALQKLAAEGNTQKLEQACSSLETGISKAMMAQGCPWN